MKKKTKMTKTRTIYKKLRHSVRGRGTSSIKTRVTKFLAGAELKRTLGGMSVAGVSGGILAIGAGYLLADVEGAAGAALGDDVIKQLTGVLGTNTTNTANSTSGGAYGTPS